MPGCEIYSTKPLDKFKSTLSNLVKKHYKKNKRAKSDFEKLVYEYFDILRKNPYFSGSDSEGFPKGHYKPDFGFRKIRFIMPELEGGSRKGRLMYVVHESSCTVFPFWIYTHEEHPKRPNDNEIAKELLKIEREISTISLSTDAEIKPLVEIVELVEVVEQNIKEVTEEEISYSSSEEDKPHISEQ